ncbi:MAG: class I SAM-dependent methyltransferase [Kordiimonadaceae bacterium]|nr:class I SAM-dependent methyltransferase [Kordiimonadaceae bacterium]
MSDLQPCVVCDSADFEPLKSVSWNFTGLGALNVTFGICKDCGHVSQDPFPTSELITAFYEQNVNYYEPDYNMELPAEPVSTRRRILALARRFKPEMGTVLEIGCGSGENLHYFKQEGWDAYGCEPSFQSGKQAQTRIGEDKITIGFADDALVSNMKYDVVFSSHVLEHVTDPKKMFGQIVNSAKDDGIVIVEVPCTRQPERLSPGWLALEHLTYFSAGGITRMAEDAGLQVIETVMDDEYHLYPAVCIVCRKPCADTKNELTYFNEYAQNRHCVAEFLKKDAKHWADVGSRIAEFDDIYLWGAGNHTA